MPAALPVLLYEHISLNYTPYFEIEIFKNVE